MVAGRDPRSLGLPESERAIPDAELVARLRRQDLSALSDAYDLYHVHVRAFAQRLLGDDAIAEDLVQDAFLALPQAIRRFRAESSLRSFLISIAINHARNHLRGAVRRRTAHSRLEKEPPPSSPDPERLAHRKQLAETLTRALDALPIEQRVAVVLCDVEDRTSAEAAQIAGVPEATIRTRVFHGRRKLRDVLSQGRVA